MKNARSVSLFLIGLLTLIAAETSAQSLGTFRWQQAPYCNVLVLNVTAQGGTFRLDGFDEQCGAGQRGGVVGTGFPNPDGTIGLGLTIISSPGGTPDHVEATVSLAHGSGPWRDSAGNSGTFQLTTAAGNGGSPRPIGGGIGASAIDANQVQRRIVGICAQGQAVGAIGPDGSVACQPTSVTSVVAGAGLAGGGSGNPVSLAVNLQYAIESASYHVGIGSQTILTEPCAAGKLVVGGGYDLLGFPSALTILGSAPWINGWFLRIVNDSGNGYTILIYKICAVVQ